jgi:cbb3-type cytochrome oxidase subunit 1
MQLGVLGALVGMSLGIYMGSNENFTLAPVHAHINLLTWVSMMLYGLFYRVVPASAKGALPTAHFGLNVLGVLIMAPSLTILLLSQAASAPVLGFTAKSIVPILAGGELLTVLSMLLFALIVFRATAGANAASASAIRDAA